MAEKRFERVSSEVIEHFTRDIWARDIGDVSAWRRRLNAVSRWAFLVFRGFFKDQCIIRASALTFTTILSIVPLLAVAFSISKGFGLQNTEFIRGLLLQIAAGRAEVADKILMYIDNTNVKTLGWVGVLALLMTVFSTVGTIEKAFNTIWNARKGRSPWRKFTDFFSVILVCPIIIIVASSFTVTIQNNAFVQELSSITAFGYIDVVLLKLAPMVMVWLAFTFAYSFIPNTPVKLSCAVLAGIVGGTLWQTAQWVFITWQIGVAKYNAIYGSFAQLPLFLVWIYVSWVIVLLGAEIGYAAQNVNVYAKQRFFGNASHAEKVKTAVLLLLFMVKRFEAGMSPLTDAELSERLGVPQELVLELFGILSDAGYTVVAESETGHVFVPAVDPERVRVMDVVTTFNELGASGAHGLWGRTFPFIDDIFANLMGAAQSSEGNMTLTEYAATLED